MQNIKTTGNKFRFEIKTEQGDYQLPTGVKTREFGVTQTHS